MSVSFPAFGGDGDDGPSVEAVERRANEVYERVLSAAEAGEEARADRIRVLLCVRLQRLLDEEDVDGDSPVAEYVASVCRKQLSTVDPERFKPDDGSPRARDREAGAGAGASELEGAVDVDGLLDRRRTPTRSFAEFEGERLERRLLDEIRRIQLFLDNPHLEIGDHANLGNLLFWGPPGTGKTLGAEVVATRLRKLGYDVDFLPLSAGLIKHHHFGKSQKRLRRVLERADADGPTVVLLDEFEQIASRDGDDGTAAMTNTVLQLTDGADAVSDVVLIGATNRRAVCDPAIFSRFDAVEFPLPSPEARVAILEGFLEGGGVTAAVSAEELGRLDLSGYSGRDVRELAGWAFTLANQDGDGDALTVTADHVAGGKRLFERRRGGTDDGSSDPR